MTADDRGAGDRVVTDSEWTRWWQETGRFELNQILHWRWDPLGVSNAFPWAADEYDCYATQIAEALRWQSATGDIAARLGAIERDQMSLPDSAAAAAVRHTAASAIAQWYEDSPARWFEFGPRPR